MEIGKKKCFDVAWKRNENLHTALFRCDTVPATRHVKIKSTPGAAIVPVQDDLSGIAFKNIWDIVEQNLSELCTTSKITLNSIVEQTGIQCKDSRTGVLLAFSLTAAFWMSSNCPTLHVRKASTSLSKCCFDKYPFIFWEVAKIEI